MPKMIQIRNVPDVLHRELKSRAAIAGMSLSDYLLREVRQVASQPTLEELAIRLKSLPPINPSIDSADIIREARGLL